MKKLLSLILVFVLIFGFSCCAKMPETPKTDETEANVESTSKEGGLFSDAVYSKDTVLGEGKTTVYIDVVTPEKTVRLTVKTDKTILGDVLLENKIAEGEEGPYGLYIKKVNGISAVYETDGAYWSLSVNGEAAVTGADSIEITDGEKYELTYTKA